MSKEKVLEYAEQFDALRIVPRTVLILYAVFVGYVAMWFKSLPDPTAPQSAFVSTIMGASVGVLGLYTSTGRNWTK